MISGVPDHVDGRMIEITQDAGGNVINPDRMWHYVEGIRNWDPIWTNHGIRIIPGPVVAVARRARHAGCRPRSSPASTRSGRSRTSCTTGHEHTWFVLTQKIIEKEFALSGSEQNPDITGRDMQEVLRGAGRLRARPRRSRRSWTTAPTSWSSATWRALVRGMNALTDEPLLDLAALEREIVARDREVVNPYAKDLQVMAIHGARRFLRRPRSRGSRRRTASSTPRPGR